jgi:hypothetical protein
MKHLKTYKLFESNSSEYIESICVKYGIEDYTINPDSSVDVDGRVNISNSGLTKIPLKFRNVSGYFYCSGNNLTTLEGAPQSVGGDFYCYNNNLTTLEGAPQSVGEGFSCRSNNLTTLEGAPQSVGGHFYCRNNNLTTLEGAPQSVGGYFDCSGNPVYSVWKLFQPDYSGIELLNYYDALREVDGNPAVVIDRLNTFLEEMGKPVVQELGGYINI